MKIGYCRVSTEDQNPDFQITALKQAGCDRIYTDRASGARSAKRPQIERCLKELTTGDILIVWKMDRLGRSLGNLITLLDELKTQSIEFQSLTESIDTVTPTGGPRGSMRPKARMSPWINAATIIYFLCTRG